MVCFKITYKDQNDDLSSALYFINTCFFNKKIKSFLPDPQFS